ncbi:MAG: rod shape-determining protein MreC [Candidatus Pacebacteria bacterium]|nr:rod shape-determining protein MreC [Candidatus Paceibacterota bacterium]
MDQKFKSRAIGLSFVFLVLLGINFFMEKNIKDFFYSRSAVVQGLVWQVAGAFAFSNQDQVTKTRNLTEENQKLLVSLAELNALKEENIFLRSALNLKDLSGHNFVDADVMGGARFNGVGFDYDDSILITRGKNDGIRKGFSVVTADKLLVGKVSEVYDNYSRVVLFTDKNSIVDIQIAKEKTLPKKEVIPEPEAVNPPETDDKAVEGDANGVQVPNIDTLPSDSQIVDPKKEVENEVVKNTYIMERTVAIAKGEGSLKASLDMFPKDVDLEDGALVVTSSLTGSYPSGFVVGKIKDPKKVDTEAYKQAEIVPAFDLRLLNKVLILKDVEIIKNESNEAKK